MDGESEGDGDTVVGVAAKMTWWRDGDGGGGAWWFIVVLLLMQVTGKGAGKSRRGRAAGASRKGRGPAEIQGDRVAKAAVMQHQRVLRPTARSMKQARPTPKCSSHKTGIEWL